MNIVDSILYQARREPPVAAMCVPGPGIGLISYRRLERAVHNVSQRLHALGLREQSIIAIRIEDVIFHTIVLLAAARLGMTTMSLGEHGAVPPVPIDLLVTDAATPSSSSSGIMILADLSWIEGEGRVLEPHQLPQTTGDGLCRLILTSGTASRTKAVPLTHKLVASRIARHPTFGSRIGNCSRIYSDLPISSSLGFQFLISTLSRGGTIFFPGADFSSTLRAIEDYRVQCLIGPPSGFENLIRWFDAVPTYQSSIEVVACAGDVLSRSLSERVRARICPHLISIYGSTEASMSAVALAHEINDIPRAVGFVTPGVSIQIVNSDGVQMPAEQEGRVRIQSEFAVDKYFGDSEESGKVFRDGWFYPGDLGTLSTEGLLVITGREQSVLNLGGDKISPETIEVVLAQFPGVTEAAAVAVPNHYGNNEICAIVAATSIKEQELRAYCNARIARPFSPVKYLIVDSLPHNANGKLDRRRLQELVRNLEPAKQL